MQHPMYYASALECAAEKITDDPELKEKALRLARDWTDYAVACGPLKLRTWKLICRDLDEWPWNEERHPAFKRIRDHLFRNDVT